MKMYTQIVTGAATAVTVDLGIVPDKVVITNLTDRTKIEYNALDTVNPNGIVADVDGTLTKAASAAAGISLVSGDKDGTVTSATTADGNGTTYTQATGTENGISIGASCAVNGASDVLLVEAYVNDNP